MSKQTNHLTLLQRLLAEFVGTFILVFVGTGLIIADLITNGKITYLGISLGFGLVVMLIIYAIGHISGAHINPAATLAFAVARHFPIRDVVPYWIAQIGGAIAASTILRLLFGNVANLGATFPTAGVIESFIIEIIIGFILMFVIISVATDTRAIGESAALAIGATVAVLALFAGLFSGASLNPARSIGPALISGNLSNLWIYILGPSIGLVAGALVYQLLRERKAIRDDIGFGTQEELAKRRDVS